jgi:hypothetical protein
MKRERANESQGMRSFKIILPQHATSSNDQTQLIGSNSSSSTSSSSSSKDAHNSDPEVQTTIVTVKQDGFVHDLAHALSEQYTGIMSNLYTGLYLHSNGSDGLWLQDAEPLANYKLQDMVGLVVRLTCFCLCMLCRLSDTHTVLV